MKRSATAVWKGSGKEGTGVLTTDSKTLENTQYSFTSRFESGTGTNPEELIAAAHAGCFCMKLSFVVGNSGFTPDELNARCTITMDDGTITGSHIELSAQIPGIDDAVFAEAVKDAEENCPISAVLSCAITVDYSLNG